MNVLCDRHHMYMHSFAFSPLRGDDVSTTKPNTDRDPARLLPARMRRKDKDRKTDGSHPWLGFWFVKATLLLFAQSRSLRKPLTRRLSEKTPVASERGDDECHRTRHEEEPALPGQQDAQRQ